MPALTESTSGAGPTGVATDAPVYVAPLPSVTEPRPSRLCVPAATVVIQGLGWATVLVAGPLFPADAATKMPASAANRNEIITGSAKFVLDPLIE